MDFYNEIVTKRNEEINIRRLLVHNNVQNEDAHMFSVYKNYDKFIVPEYSEIEKNIPQILKKHQDVIEVGKHSICSENEFNKHFEAYTENLLRHINWNNVVCAGGAVNACLMPVPESYKNKISEYYNKIKYTDSDVDLFIYGLSPLDAENKLIEITNKICNALPCPAICIRSTNAISIVSQYPFRHIQIITKLYKSPLEVIMSFDIDSCAFAYDGSDVWGLPRSLYSMVRRTNVVDLTRRSLSYEYRLQKYNRRGFSVMVPELDNNRIDMRIYSKKSNHVKGLARLLILEHMDNNIKHNVFNDVLDHHQAMMIRNITLNSNYENSDYSLVYLPWSEEWNAQNICETMSKKVSELEKKVTDDKGIPYMVCIMGTMEDVIVGRNTCRLIGSNQICGSGSNECVKSPIFNNTVDEEKYYETYVAGTIRWVTNEGKEMIGSFHLPQEINWYEDAYIPLRIDDLCNAISNNDLNRIDTIINSINNKDDLLKLLNSRDTSQRNPISIAIMNNNHNIITKLFELGAYPTIKLKDGRTPLHLACQVGNQDIVEAIIKYGKIYNETDMQDKFDIKILDNYKLSPITYTVIYGHFELFKYMIEQLNYDFNDVVWTFKLDNNKNYNLLKLCLIYKRYDIAKYALEHNYDPYDKYYKQYNKSLKTKDTNFKKYNHPILLGAFYAKDIAFAKILTDYYYTNNIDYKLHLHQKTLLNIAIHMNKTIDSLDDKTYAIDTFMFMCRILNYQLPIINNNKETGTQMEKLITNIYNILNVTMFDFIIKSEDGIRYLIDSATKWNIDFNLHGNYAKKYNVKPYFLLDRLNKYIDEELNKNKISFTNSDDVCAQQGWYYIDIKNNDNINDKYKKLLDDHLNKTNVQSTAISKTNSKEDYLKEKWTKINRAVTAKEYLEKIGSKTFRPYQCVNAVPSTLSFSETSKKVNIVNIPLTYYNYNKVAMVNLHEYKELYESIINNDINKVKSLINNLNVCVYDSAGLTPLHISIIYGNNDITNVLLDTIHNRFNIQLNEKELDINVIEYSNKLANEKNNKRKLYVNNISSILLDDDDEEYEDYAPPQKVNAKQEIINDIDVDDNYEDHDYEYDDVEVDSQVNESEKHECDIKHEIFNSLLEYCIKYNYDSLATLTSHKFYGKWFEAHTIKNIMTIINHAINYEKYDSATDLLMKINKIYDENDVYLNYSVAESKNISFEYFKNFNSKKFLFAANDCYKLAHADIKPLFHIEDTIMLKCFNDKLGNNLMSSKELSDIYQIDSCKFIFLTDNLLSSLADKNINENTMNTLITLCNSYAQYKLALFECIKVNNINLFKKILLRTDQLSITHKLMSSTNYKNQTQLITTVINNRVDFAKILLSYGVDQDSVDIFGNTALHYAYYYCNIPIIKILRTHQKENYFRMSPQDYVIQNIKGMVHHSRNENIISNLSKSILKYGPDVYNRYILNAKLPARELADTTKVKLMYEFIFDQLTDKITSIPDSLKL